MRAECGSTHCGVYVVGVGVGRERVRGGRSVGGVGQAVEGLTLMRTVLPAMRENSFHMPNTPMPACHRPTLPVCFPPFDNAQVRERDATQAHGLRVSELSYDHVPDPERTADPSRNSWDEDYEAALRDMHGSGGGPSAGNWAWAEKIRARSKEAGGPGQGAAGAGLPGSGGMAGPGTRSFAIAGRSAGPNVPPPPAVGAKKAPKKGKK